MNWRFVLVTCICVFGMLNFSIAQGNDPLCDTTCIEAKIKASEIDEIESNRKINEIDNKNYGNCSLIQNHARDREITTSKNGYKIVTSENDEILEVKNKKNRTVKIKYLSDQEELRYKIKNGKETYTYDFIDGCEKKRVKKDKSGILSASKNSYENLNDIQMRVLERVQSATNSCIL